VISAVLLNNRPIEIIEVKVARQLISCRFAIEATMGRRCSIVRNSIAIPQYFPEWQIVSQC
jgi:hypothetical protein